MTARTCCDNFLYGFKGAPPARQAPGRWPRSQAGGREVIERECVTETGTTTKTKREGGRATVRPRGGGHVAPLRAEALRARRRQVRLPRFRRPTVPAVTLRRWSRLQMGA
jgi:hypothetical protein